MRMVEASFPEHGERQMLMGTGVWFPEGDQEPNWEGSDATARADSRRKGSRAEQPRHLALEDITCGPPFPQPHPGPLGPLENRREDQGFLQESHRQQTQGSPESQGQQPLPASTPPTHAGNNQKGWLALSWLTLPAPGTGERQGVLLKGGQQP